jgi:hypothetical protein
MRPEAREIRVRAASGRKALTALPATGGENRAAGAGAHPQPEPMGLGAPAVVRLERALAHSRTPEREIGRRSTGRNTASSVRWAPAGHKDSLRYGPIAETVKPGRPRHRPVGVMAADQRSLPAG